MIEFLVKLASWISLPRKKINYDLFFKLRDELRIGDIILTKRKWSFTNLFIPGKYKHAMVYIGAGLVLESISEGVVARSLNISLSDKDLVKLIRPNFTDEASLSLLIFNSYNRFVGIKYDLTFEDKDKLYCFELIVELYTKVFEALSFDTYKRLGREVYLAKTFTNSKLFNPIMEINKLRIW